MQPQVRHSVCALDCPDTCGLLINVEERNGIKAPRRSLSTHYSWLPLRQSRPLPRSRIFSPKPAVPDAPDRSQRRRKFERISWDGRWRRSRTSESTIDELGSESILPYSYAGTMGMLNGSGMDRRFFHKLGASRLDRTICSAAGAAGLRESVGARYGMEPEQFRHSKLIIAWGANVLGTNVHLWPFILEARRKGAKFYVIDPVVNRTGNWPTKYSRFIQAATSHSHME